MECVFLPAVLPPFHRCLVRCAHLASFSRAVQIPPFCHLFPNKPHCGQCVSTTFPCLFYFFLLSFVTTLLVFVKGEAIRLQHVHLFPPTPSSAAASQHLHARLLSLFAPLSQGAEVTRKVFRALGARFFGICFWGCLKATLKRKRCKLHFLNCPPAIPPNTHKRKGEKRKPSLDLILKAMNFLPHNQSLSSNGNFLLNSQGLIGDLVVHGM